MCSFHIEDSRSISWWPARVSAFLLAVCEILDIKTFCVTMNQLWLLKDLAWQLIDNQLIHNKAERKKETTRMLSAQKTTHVCYSTKTSQWIGWEHMELQRKSKYQQLVRVWVEWDTSKSPCNICTYCTCAPTKMIGLNCYITHMIQLEFEWYCSVFKSLF